MRMAIVIGLLGASLMNLRCAAEPAFGEPESAKAVDVLVYGATPGGIAAAVAAARHGCTVVLAASEDHIGGIVANGLTNADIGRRQAVGGFFYDFSRRVVRHYQAIDRNDPRQPNLKASKDGYHYEAHVAERIFHAIVAEHAPLIELRLQHDLRNAEVANHGLTAVVLEDAARPGRLIRHAAKVFVDATYEGDLAALANAPCRTGREGRDEFGEPHAGHVYLRFGTSELLPGSTGEADGATEAYCFRFHVTNVAANRVLIEKPENFRREDYATMLQEIRSGKARRFHDFVQLIPMPGGKFELNSDHPHPETGVPSESLDLAEENWEWPTATAARRREIYDRYLAHNVGLIWLLQNDPELPLAIREDARQWGWCRDEWPDHDHVPRQIYVRQGRRIEGAAILTERDAEIDPELRRTRLQPTSVGVVEWAFDPHGCHRYDPVHPGVREGYFFIDHEPFQIPYGVLVPRTIDGLLVPVACSCSHVAYNALRMEPVFMALGEASGLAAHLAVRRGVPVRHAPVAELQRLLVEAGGVITFYDDLPFGSPHFAAFQWLGARGMNPGYQATPDRPLTRRDGWTKLGRILRSEGITWSAPQIDPEAPLRGSDLAAWLREAGYEPPADAVPEAHGEQPLHLAQFADMLFRTLAPR